MSLFEKLALKPIQTKLINLALYHDLVLLHSAAARDCRRGMQLLLLKVFAFNITAGL
jgi:hypothetical protein